MTSLPAGSTSAQDQPLWNRLGAHCGADGVRFSVWAPRAASVSVIGDANDWNPDRHPMTRDDEGVWHVSVESMTVGDLYQFSVLDTEGIRHNHADPLARRSQIPPQRASVVEQSQHRWHDDAWMAARADRVPYREPMRTYEVHLPSWRRGLGYRDLIDTLVPYVHDLGFTHVEFMPLTEYPYHGSWGYQVSGYFCPTARLGAPDDLRALVDAFHQVGIAVILDWVPGHFPRDDWALARFDGQPLYEPREAALHPQWGTLPFDLARPQVREFLIASALYWLDEFHIDGLRVDAVENILFPPHAPRGHDEHQHPRVDLDAVEFLQHLNIACHAAQPGIAMIAEDASTYPRVTAPVEAGGLGFGFKWSLGWMHDTLRYLIEDPLWRQNHHHQIVLPSSYADREHWVLPLSHDEVVHGKGPLLDRFPGDRSAQLSTLRALLAWQWGHPGRPLIFMGTELAQTREWSHRRSLDWAETIGAEEFAGLLRDLNTLHDRHPALWAGDHATSGFRWLLADDASHNVVAFERSHEDDTVVVVSNFSGIDHVDHRLHLDGCWTVQACTAWTAYGGAGGPTTVVGREPLVLPALSTLWLTPDRPLP